MAAPGASANIGGNTPFLSGRGAAQAQGGPLSPAFVNPLAAMFGAGLYHKSMADTPSSASSTPGQGSYVGPLSGNQYGGEPFAVWVGMLALLWLLAWFSSRPDSLGGANPAFIKVGGYNFLTIGVSSAVFIILLKVIANKTKFPGFLEFANAL
jgi:hypothetical protein